LTTNFFTNINSLTFDLPLLPHSFISFSTLPCILPITMFFTILELSRILLCFSSFLIIFHFTYTIHITISPLSYISVISSFLLSSIVCSIIYEIASEYTFLSELKSTFILFHIFLVSSFEYSSIRVCFHPITAYLPCFPFSCQNPFFILTVVNSLPMRFITVPISLIIRSITVNHYTRSITFIGSPLSYVI